jgi:Co/Zn/Cd efflux system component
LNAAYLHVAADALTSALAVVALLSAKYLDALWVDPVVAIAGVFLIGRWCWDLLSRTGRVLLDRQAPHGVRRQVIAAIEADGDSRVADLHLWSIGPGIHAAAITVIAHRPETADGYRALLPAAARVVHATIEVHTCPDHPPVGGAESGRIEAAVPSRSRAHGRSAIGGG